MKRYAVVTAFAVVLGLGIALGLSVRPATGQAETPTMVYELRTYVANEGKFEDLHARFRDHTMGLFEKHGMKNIGYWVPLEEENTLIYIVAHASREQARENWRAFGADPEWRAAYAKSHENGVLVAKVESVFMNPTDYSPIR